MPHDHKVGETVPVSVAFKDGAGQPLAATGVAIVARRPDGSTVAGAAAASGGVGEFEASFLADAAGLWLVKAECAGPVVVRDEASFRVSRLRFDTA